jgi:hypothetical protein
MTLVLMDPVWSHLPINDLLGTALAVLIVALPWILGGIDPSREDLTWSILSFTVGLLSVSAVVLSAYDLARSDASD